MLRMAHRLLTSNKFGVFSNLEIEDVFSKCAEQSHKDASSAMCMIIDNVADYYVTWGDDDDGFQKFGVCCPPFDNMLIEYNPPATENGLFGNYQSVCVHVIKTDAFHIAIIWLSVKGELILWPGLFEFQFDENGCLSSSTYRSATITPQPHLSILTPVGPAILAMAFMHCKNVVRRDVTETEGPSAKWIRRQKAPSIRYHVLDINPMKEVLRSEGNIESNGLKKALHICRGHFVHYSEDRPLFGKVSGTFWKAAHVRGKAEEGIVIKDYQIKTN